MTIAICRALMLGVLAGLLVLLVMLVVPITGHHGDGEQACGSVLHHARNSGMLPRVDGAVHVNIAQSSDACPPKDYRHRQSSALGTASIASGGALAAGVVMLRRRRNGT